MSRPSPVRRLRILHLEDSELDHQLILVHLRRGGIEAKMLRVDNERDFLMALQQPWDAVLSDYNLPGFSGLVALELLRKRDTSLPFVLVSGEIGEDTAVAAMRNGASDYLLKSNLARLVPAVLHAVEACESRKARERADTELAQSRKRLSELAQHLQTSIEMERTAIAREVHDDVGGALTAVKFDLAWIARNGVAAPVRERALQALESLNHAIEASQRIMHNLRPAILEQGLVAALQWMTQRFERRTGIVTTFRTSHDHLALPTGVPLVAYRTAQEALTNISKHADARHVRVDLTMAAGVLSLEISDDGRGLASGDLGKDRSFGLRGLHERADTVGGWIDMSSSSRGTTLILSVPLAGARTHSSRHELGEDGGPLTSPHDPSTWGDL